MSLRHGLAAFALLVLATVTVACPMAIDEEELTETPQASPVADSVAGTPSAPAEAPSPPPDALAECGSSTPEARLPDGQARIEAPADVATPEPFVPMRFTRDAELESRLRDALGADVASYSIVVKNLADGSGASVNPDRQFYAASLFKVAVMYEAFHQRSLGLLSFDEELLETPYYAGFDLGTHAFPVCSTATVGQLLAAMMSVSDNASAVMLQDKLGSRHINEAMEALGLPTTRLLENDLPTTASDMARLMEMIASGKAVDADASQAMVDLLASEEVDNGLRAGVPEGTLVAHKTGNWLNATHDVGIVYSPPSAGSGEPGVTYVMAVLSDKGFGDDADVLITELSRLVWEHYNGADNDGG